MRLLSAGASWAPHLRGGRTTSAGPQYLGGCRTPGFPAPVCTQGPAPSSPATETCWGTKPAPTVTLHPGPPCSGLTCCMVHPPRAQEMATLSAAPASCLEVAAGCCASDHEIHCAILLSTLPRRLPQPGLGAASLTAPSSPCPAIHSFLCES